MPGRASIASADAASRSTGAVDGGSWGVGFGVFDRERALSRAARFALLAARVESTRPSCRSSARTSAAGGAGVRERQARTPVPEIATSARNQSPLRSFGVGMHNEEP
jgi:hypothetical protein